MRIEVSAGLENLTKQLDQLAAKSRSISRAALGEAAGVTIQEVKKAIQTLPVEKSRFGTPEKPLTGVTARQKADLLNSVGIARFRDSGGTVNTSIGFDGYGSTKTKKYPGGVPNAMLARSIESGTSFRKKTPFMRKAQSAIKGRALQAAEEKATEMVKKFLK